MKTLLHINSSPRGNCSVSRKLTSEVVVAWKAKNPKGKVIERDLAKSPSRALILFGLWALSRHLKITPKLIRRRLLSRMNSLQNFLLPMSLSSELPYTTLLFPQPSRLESITSSGLEKRSPTNRMV